MLKLLALAGLGYAGYRYYQKHGQKSSAAFAGNQGSATIRDSGPESMRTESKRDWTKVDEQSDESFPASDPPANY